MSLRLFSDQCVPAEITDTLRRNGHQVTLLREVLPIRSIDPLVIAKAYPPANFLGIIAVQLHNHPEIIPQLMERLVAFLDAHRDQEFYHGKLFLIEVHRVRMRQ
jgi:hypothetical protein